MSALATAPAPTGKGLTESISTAERALLTICRDAVAACDELRTVSALKIGLVELAKHGTLAALDFPSAHADRYSRRLVYSDPWNRFVVIAMTWGAGQSTPLHDHAGVWCVEVVVDGAMEAVSYQLIEEDSFGHCRFEQRETIAAPPASSGALIPPFEHHIFRNAVPVVSRTLHVYGGPMNHCDIFERVSEGWWQRQHRELRYDA
jgi:predicted metal-dependent enzyme (double-stranded beta helix superfamily)